MARLAYLHENQLSGNRNLVESDSYATVRYKIVYSRSFRVEWPVVSASRFALASTLYKRWLHQAA